MRTGSSFYAQGVIYDPSTQESACRGVCHGGRGRGGRGEGEDIASFAGLGRRHPALAAAMTLFMLSLTGVPLTAGGSVRGCSVRENQAGYGGGELGMQGVAQGSQCLAGWR